MKNYNDLFCFVARQLEECPCDHTLKNAKRFAEQNDLFFGELTEILEGFNGFCDCEVLLNVTGVIDGAELIGQNEIETPGRYAARNGLFCHCLVDGVPTPFVELEAARCEGKSVRFHVPCKREDSYACPDLNAAMESLCRKMQR